MGVFKKGLVYLFKDFSMWTSTHGIPHIGMANAMWLRAFWILVVIGAAGAFIWQLITLLTNYFAYQVNTETTLQFSERVFPSVTICHLNPWKRGEAAAALPIMDDMIAAYEADDVSSTEFGFPAGLNSDRQKRAVILTSLMSEKLQNAPTQLHGYSYEDLVISCTYNAQSCGELNFEPYPDSNYGRCWKFNANGNFSSSRAGPLYGLRMVIRTNQTLYLPWTEASGVVVSIHGQDETPFPDVFGYYAPPGTASSMGVRFLSTTRLPDPYGTCTLEKEANFPHYKGPYEVEACFRNCLQENIIEKCGCYDAAYPFIDDGSISCLDMNTTEAVDCLEAIVNSDVDSGFNIIRDCECPQPCEVETYAVTVSTAQWPSNKFTPTECSNKASGMNMSDCLEFYKTQTLLIEIYYERMNYQVLTESPSYTFVNLISDVGGQVGLFLGMSIISLIEILTMVFLVFCYCATHKKRKVEIENIEKEMEEARKKNDALRKKHAAKRRAEGNDNNNAPDTTPVAPKSTEPQLTRRSSFYRNAGAGDPVPPPVMEPK